MQTRTPKVEPEFSTKREGVRNRKKKEKMEGYNDLKPQHQPYKREAIISMVNGGTIWFDDEEWDDEEDYRGFVTDDD